MRLPARLNRPSARANRLHNARHAAGGGSGRRHRAPTPRAARDDRPPSSRHGPPWGRPATRRLLLAVALGLGLGLAAPSTAAGQVRTYLPDAADEDWSFLKGAAKTDVWDPLKYIPLGREDWFMTLSGQARYRVEGFRIRSTAASGGVTDSYVLQRYLFGSDVHLGKRVRAFAEVQSGMISGRLRSPRPSDRNAIDLHQGFVEWRQPLAAERHLAVKVGRQELAIGSTRLISASPGLNVKRSFEGATIAYRTKGWSLAGAGARLVGVKSGAFDDRPEGGQVFWGAAASRRHPRVAPGEIGAYYLGLRREHAVYAQGSGLETRHTIGAKWSRTGERLALNYDVLIQWGRFADAAVRAWGIATETTYVVTSSGWRPRISLRLDVASGDAAADDARLQSFNPLFPGNSYAGAVGLLGPTNLSDVTAAVSFVPRPAITVGLEVPSYWRTSTGDGVYGTDLRLLIPAAAGSGRYVGSNPGVLLAWRPATHWHVQAVITRFLPGRFLDRTIIASGFGFYSGSLVYRF